MKLTKDLTGNTFGHLLVKERAPNRLIGNRYRSAWVCECACGNLITALSEKLSSGRHISCGCMNPAWNGDNARTHGMTGTRVYKIWKGMVNRCCNKNNGKFWRYSALGISEEFKQFHKFYAHVGDPPTTNSSIDRIDNTKGYFPGNVRWSSPKTQARNTRRNMMIEYNGENKSLAEWCDLLKIPYMRTFLRIRRYNYTIEQAFHD